MGSGLLAGKLLGVLIQLKVQLLLFFVKQTDRCVSSIACVSREVM